MSAIDLVFDKSFFDILREIQAVEDGSKEVQSLAFYKHLKPDWQQRLIKNPKHVRYFKTLFDDHQRVHQHSYLRAVEYVLISSDAAMERGYTHIAQMADMFNSAKKSLLYYAADHGILNGGGSRLISLAMIISFKRFRDRFGFQDFLPCSLRTDDYSYLHLCRQMVQSRLHFILNGEFLPILAFFNDSLHATSILILPVPVALETSGLYGEVVWNFIHINSNGDEDVYIERLTTIPQKAFQRFLEVFKDFSQKNSMKEFKCIQNIQRDNGTCLTWAILLVFQIFADIETLLHSEPPTPAGDGDHSTPPSGERDRSTPSSGEHETQSKIEKFCIHLSKMMRLRTSSNRYNRCIVHLLCSFQVLVLEAYVNAANPGNKELGPPKTQFGPPVFASTGESLIPTVREFANELFFGIKHSTIELDATILETMRKIQQRLRKHMRIALTPRNATVLESDVNTDEESENEKAHSEIVLQQRREYEANNEKLDYSIGKLEHLRTKINTLMSENRPVKSEVDEDDDDDDDDLDAVDDTVDIDVVDDTVGIDAVDLDTDNDKSTDEFKNRLQFKEKQLEFDRLFDAITRHGQTKEKWMDKYFYKHDYLKLYACTQKMRAIDEKLKQKDVTDAEIDVLQQQLKQLKDEKQKINYDQPALRFNEFVKDNDNYFLDLHQHEETLRLLLDLKNEIEHKSERKGELSDLHDDRLDFQKKVRRLFSKLHYDFGFPQPPIWWLTKALKSLETPEEREKIDKQIEAFEDQIRQIESKSVDSDEDPDMDDFDEIGRLQEKIEKLPKIAVKSFLSFVKLNNRMIRNELKCRKIMVQLVNSKELIEKTDPSSPSYQDYKETFQRQSMKLLSLMSIEEPHLLKWFSEFFKRKMKFELEKITAQIDEWTDMLEEFKSTIQKTKAREDYDEDNDEAVKNASHFLSQPEKFLNDLVKQRKDLTHKLRNEFHLQQSDDFWSFINRMKRRPREEDR
jgi:hypothetical protein